MRRRSLALICLFLLSGAAHGQRVRVVDEEGAGVSRFEAMYHTEDHGYGQWKAGQDGSCSFPQGALLGSAVVDVIVRADGYSATVQRFDRQSMETLRRGDAVIVLEKGREIALRLDVPEDRQLPDDLLPQVYPPQFAGRVRTMWQPVNQRRGGEDFNFLNLQSRGAGDFSLRLPAEPAEFYVAIQHPGWLRFWEVGPFTSEDIVDDTLTLEVPKPATIEVRLDTDGADRESLPFDGVECRVMWPNPDRAGSMYSVTDRNSTLEDGVFRVGDLGPGAYHVYLTTMPKDGVQEVPGTGIHPGRFRVRRTVQGVAGQTTTEAISYVPFDAEAWRGSGQARIQVTLPSGEPAAGRQLRITWFGGHYDTLTVFNGPVPDEGTVHLNGISRKMSFDAPFGPYTAVLDGQTLGFFRLEQFDDIQEFKFQVAPAAGDLAPDFAFLDIETEEEHHLTEFRGQVVVIEFWATWCGPCQPAMTKLTELAVANAADWQGRVAVIPVSTDERIDLVAHHISATGWDAIPQYWAIREGDEYFATAERRYGIYGIPEAILIDANGKVVWRGHPTQPSDGVGLVERIESLLHP